MGGSNLAAGSLHGRAGPVATLTARVVGSPATAAANHAVAGLCRACYPGAQRHARLCRGCTLGNLPAAPDRCAIFSTNGQDLATTALRALRSASRGRRVP